MRDALESEQCGGRTNAVCDGTGTRSVHDDRVVRDLRHRAGDRLLLAAAVPAGRAGGAAGPKPGARASSESDAGADRRGGDRAAARAHEMGSAETKTSIGAGSSADAVAGGEHHRCDAGAGRVGGAAQEKATRAALHATVCSSRWAEPGLVR